MIVIYGPPASGKTRNAEALRKAFGCKRVLDEYPDPHAGKPTAGDLVLSNYGPEELARRLPRAQLVHIDAALARIGKQ